jgi:ABC-2 type transport system permease protein
VNAIRALLFIAQRSLVNAARRQLSRLRQPRYLAASAVGLFYLWGVFARHHVSAARTGPLRLELTLTSALLLGLSLLVLLWTWLFGGDEAALHFSEAEIQFLFPAPLTRRALVHYKLLRSVALSGFTALFLTFGLGQRMGVAGLPFFLGAWLGAATLALHGIAVSLTRGSLLQHGTRGPVRRALWLVVPLALVACTALAMLRAPTFPSQVQQIPAWYQALLAGPWMRAATVLCRPALEVALGTAHFTTLLAALGLLAGNYLWALGSDADFTQGSLALAEKRSRRLEARRRGQLPLRAARAPFRLGASGHPAVGIFWKNLTAAVRLLSLRTVVLMALPLAFLLGALVLDGGSSRRELAAGACLMAALYLTLFGSQIYRIDFRLDLGNLDLLRTLPLSGRELAAAEVAAPWSILTAGQWLLIGLAGLLVPPQVLGAQSRLAATVALAIAAPAATLCLILVQNAGALLFPAWVAAGVQGPRGIEAMGQRLLTLFGTLLAVAVALVPAALAAGGTFLLLGPRLGALALPVASCVGAAVVAVESALALDGLGRLFDRADLGVS